MLEALTEYKGIIKVNGKQYDNIESAETALKAFSGKICIKLCPKAKNANKSESERSTNTIQAVDAKEVYKITVKQYMTRKATPEFDFMAKWNNDNPMPLRIMRGTIEKETRGMVYMKLHGFGERTVTCMCCGKELKNPVSRFYGIGPVCMGKVGIVADIEDISTITEKLEEIEWEGWIIRSAITEQIEL